MIIADLAKIEGRTYPARRRTQSMVGQGLPITAEGFCMGYVTLEPNGGRTFSPVLAAQTEWSTPT